jgi:uncharacterized membrane protein
VPLLASYVLSFVYVAIYWNNHHHLLHACERINGASIWANMSFLFWLSLIPFVTATTATTRTPIVRRFRLLSARRICMPRLRRAQFRRKLAARTKGAP